MSRLAYKPCTQVMLWPFAAFFATFGCLILTPNASFKSPRHAKADPATMMIEDIQAEAIRSRLSQTGGSGQLQTYSSTADAIAAGLKSGDQFIGSDGNTYTVQ